MHNMLFKDLLNHLARWLHIKLIDSRVHIGYRIIREFGYFHNRDKLILHGLVAGINNRSSQPKLYQVTSVS